jgi:crossover junction endodeoxyribonuclease RusA
MNIEIRIPFPPSANHYWGNRVVQPRGKRPIVMTYLTARAKAYRADVEAAVVEHLGLLRPTTAKLRVRITATMPDRRKRDLSNLLKASEDALVHAKVMEDDYQIDHIEVVRGPVNKPGWLDVEIWPVEC